MLNKTLKRVYRNLQGYLISRFNKYPRNLRNFLSSILIRPTVYSCYNYCIAGNFWTVKFLEILEITDDIQNYISEYSLFLYLEIRILDGSLEVLELTQ